MYLVADDAQILLEKDIAWSAINLPDDSATPSSLEENNLPAEDQQPNEPRRKSQLKNNLQKVRNIDCFTVNFELIISFQFVTTQHFSDVLQTMTLAKYFQQKKF